MKFSFFVVVLVFIKLITESESVLKWKRPFWPNGFGSYPWFGQYYLQTYVPVASTDVVWPAYGSRCDLYGFSCPSVAPSPATTFQVVPIYYNTKRSNKGLLNKIDKIDKEANNVFKFIDKLQIVKCSYANAKQLLTCKGY